MKCRIMRHFIRVNSVYRNKMRSTFILYVNHNVQTLSFTMDRSEFTILSVYRMFVMPLCESVYLCLVVTCWERADFLALVCGV